MDNEMGYQSSKYTGQIPQNNFKQMSNYSNSNMNNQNNNNNNQSGKNPRINSLGYVNNSSTLEDPNGYSNSTGIYDQGTLMFINSRCNNIYQCQNKFNNNSNQNMYQNNMNNNNQNMYQNNMNNSNQNMYQNNMSNSNQNMYQNNMNNSNQNIQKFNNNQNYQQINNNNQNIQQNNYNRNQQQFIQNNNSPNTQRNNYNNMHQQFINNNQNMQPNINNFNNQNNYPPSQRSEYIPMPQKYNYNDDLNNQNIRNNQRRFSQQQQVFNNIYQNVPGNNNSQRSGMNLNPNQNMLNNNNNYLNNPLIQNNNVVPNQFSNNNFNNQKSSQPFYPNRNINNNPQIQYNNQHNNMGNQVQYPNNMNANNMNVNNNNKNNDIQKLSEDVQNNLNIDQHNKNGRQNNNIDEINEQIKKENPPKKKEKDTEDIIFVADDKIKFLENDTLVSIAESIAIEDYEENKENQIKNNDENNKKDQEKSNNYNSNMNNNVQNNSNEFNNNNNNKKDKEDNEFNLLKDDCNPNPYAKNREEDDNFNLLSSVKDKGKEVQIDNNNNNVNQEGKKEEDFFFGNLGNDSMFPGVSVLDSVQISDEMPFDAHNHPLSIESLKNETCTICNKEKTCEQGYKCKDCPLILCDQCSYNVRIEYYSHSKHDHSLCIINKENLGCNICKKQTKFLNFYFNCRQCNFNICLNCYNPDRKKEDNVLLHEHPLIHFNESFLLKCQLCENGTNCGYNCKSCEIVLCNDCANNMYSHKKRYELHEHPLFLTLRDKWECVSCKCGFKNTLSFHCKKCSLDYCADCFLE